MGISELRQLGVPAQTTPAERLDFELIRSGAVNRHDMALARQMQEVCDASIDRVLTGEGLASAETLLEIHARTTRSRRLRACDLAALAPLDIDLAPQLLIRHGVLPVRDRDGAPALVCSDPQGEEAIRPFLPAALDGARLLWAPRSAVQERLAELHRPALSEAMVSRVDEAESCRSWSGQRRARLIGVMLLLAGSVAATIAFPRAVFALLVGWAVLTLVVAALFKTAAFVSRLVTGPAAPPPPPGHVEGRLPRVSILVPLFRETEILHALVARLSALTYPKCLLDVILVLEEEDDQTRRALAGIDLPSWIRAVVVPDGQPRTKPRAMNYALDFCEGDIIGIYDAEDAPEADQIAQVARRFLQLPPEVACIQGYLDYYNPRQNWLARCFTIEYAAWFRMLLPGMARLGLAIPLGGTTLFFRRDALEALGGWDSHNVTEDADLGFRLARHGYRTEMLATTTHEEANCRTWPWIKQRSRWLKGYMTTYLVHMRKPLVLLRQLGQRRFLGFQAHFVTALSQVLLAPLLWSFWLMFLGLPHPLDPLVPQDLMMALGVLFITIEVLNLIIHATAVVDRRHRHLLPWVVTMHLYYPLNTVAAYKALYELVFKPFFWDKTRHGLSLNPAAPGRGAPDQGAQDQGEQDQGTQDQGTQDQGGANRGADPVA